MEVVCDIFGKNAMNTVCQMHYSLIINNLLALLKLGNTSSEVPPDISTESTGMEKRVQRKVCDLPIPGPKPSYLSPALENMHQDLFPAVTQFLQSREQVSFIQQKASNTRTSPASQPLPSIVIYTFEVGHAMPVPIPKDQLQAFHSKLDEAMALVNILEPGLVMYNALLPPHQAPLFANVAKSVRIISPLSFSLAEPISYIRRSISLKNKRRSSMATPTLSSLFHKSAKHEMS